MWRCDYVGGLGEHVKKHVLWFLRYTILTIYTSYNVFPPKDVPFGGLVHTAPHFGGKIPKTPILGA